eukprot:COSAG01_NODE_3711_length_5769_cov_10.210545_3_plen_57_part_00
MAMHPSVGARWRMVLQGLPRAELSAAAAAADLFGGWAIRLTIDPVGGRRGSAGGAP